MKKIDNNKKRILMCAESHDINSGFGRYTREILSRLYKNPNYEIAEFASYLKDNTSKNVPWKVYPNEPMDDSQDIERFKSNPINQFGQWRFEKVVLHFKPDIVFDIRDYWMFSYQETSVVRKYFKWIIAPTVDSIPQKPEWLQTFQNADIVLTHTDWAGSYLKSLNRGINVGPSVSDSVDSDTFKPLDYTKSYHKSLYNIPSDSIIIGAVMRNQKRKLIAELFKSLRKLIDQTKNNNIYLYLHTSYPEKGGWDIPELLHEYGVENNVLFTYYSIDDSSIFVSKFKGPRIISPSNSYAIFPNVKYGVNNEQLNQIYNLFDIYVQYAICEGLGIPQLEAASCGVPIFAINYSGMEEITDKLEGVKIDHILATELETGADRAVPDNDHLVQEIIKWINLSGSEKRQLSSRTRKLLLDNYSWDKTTEKLTSVFDSIEHKRIWNEPMTINTGISIPENLSGREFINYIVENVLQEKYLLKTYYIQSLIRTINEQYDQKNNVLSDSLKKDIVKHLEVYLNNKIFCEKIRSGEIVSNEQFLEY